MHLDWFPSFKKSKQFQNRDPTQHLQSAEPYSFGDFSNPNAGGTNRSPNTILDEETNIITTFESKPDGTGYSRMRDHELSFPSIVHDQPGGYAKRRKKGAEMGWLIKAEDASGAVGSLMQNHTLGEIASAMGAVLQRAMGDKRTDQNARKQADGAVKGFLANLERKDSGGKSALEFKLYSTDDSENPAQLRKKTEPKKIRLDEDGKIHEK